MGRVTVPPILSRAAISLSALRRPLVARRVLPGLPARLRCERARWSRRRVATSTDEPAPRTLLPLSRRSRLAAGITAGAVGLLHQPFQPLPEPLRAIGGNACCCRLASRAGHPARAPACCFAGRPSTQWWARSREVPLGDHPSGGISRAFQPHYTMAFKARRTTAPRRRAPSSNSAGASRLKARRR